MGRGRCNRQTDVGNGEVVEPVREFRLLERLGAECRRRETRFGDTRGQRVNLDAVTVNAAACPPA